MAVSVETDNGSKFREVSVALSPTWGIYIPPHPMPVRDHLWSRRERLQEPETGEEHSKTWWDNCTMKSELLSLLYKTRTSQSSQHSTMSGPQLLQRSFRQLAAAEEEELTVFTCVALTRFKHTSVQTWAGLLAHEKRRKRRKKTKPSEWLDLTQTKPSRHELLGELSSRGGEASHSNYNTHVKRYSVYQSLG